MKKYNIKKNRPQLSQEEIEKGMDFNRIKANATKAKWSLTKKILAGGATAITVATIGFLLNDGFGNKSTNQLNDVVTLPTTDNLPDTFVVNSERDTTLIFNTGTKISISANTFMDKSGNPVKGIININYREFHKVSEILLSNIPMRYDSAGKEMYFESAGMFDISANQNNNPIFIKTDKNIGISMATLDTNKTKYNQYILNENTKQWAFIKKDTVSVLSQPVNVGFAKADTARRTASYTNGRMFIIDATGRPDLEVYNNVVFEVTKDCKSFNPAESKVQWGMVEVEKLNKTNKYRVTFSKPNTGQDRFYEVVAVPVNEKDMNKFDKISDELKGKQNDLENKLKSEQAAYKTIYQNFKNLQLSIQNQKQIAEVEGVVYRTFQINQFGVFNSDCPQSMPKGIEVFASFENEKGKNVGISAVYLVEKGKNAMYSLYIPKKFSFNPNAENILLVVTNDFKLGWVSKDVFKGIKTKDKNVTFKLNLLDKKSYTTKDIDNILI